MLRSGCSGSRLRRSFGKVRTFIVQLTRGLGELTVAIEDDAESGFVHVLGFPQDYDLICYAEGVQGCLESSIVRGRGKGSVTLVDSNAKNGDLHFHAVWMSRNSVRPPRG